MPFLSCSFAWVRRKRCGKAKGSSSRQQSMSTNKIKLGRINLFGLFYGLPVNKLYVYVLYYPVVYVPMLCIPSHLSKDA